MPTNNIPSPILPGSRIYTPDDDCYDLTAPIHILTDEMVAKLNRLLTAIHIDPNASIDRMYREWATNVMMYREAVICAFAPIFDPPSPPKPKPEKWKPSRGIGEEIINHMARSGNPLSIHVIARVQCLCARMDADHDAIDRIYERLDKAGI